MSRTDPVERASNDDSIYEVTGWEPTSTFDRLVVGLYAMLIVGAKWTVVLAGVLVTAAIATVTALDLVLEPFVVWLVALSVAPAIVLAVYLWWADVTTGEPIRVLSATFLLAVFTAGFAAPLNDLGRTVVSSIAGPAGEFVVYGLLFFLVVGPVEEGVKLLSVRLYAYNHDRFDAVIDGAVYGAVAGLGFATIENALYITTEIDAGGGLAELTLTSAGNITAARALAGPGHVLYSSIAGYYLGLAKYNPDNWGPIVMKGLLVAALFHGFYNTTVGLGGGIIAALTPLPGFGGVLVYIVCFQLLIGYYLYRKIDRYRRAFEAHDAGQTPYGGAEETIEGPRRR